MLVDLASSRFMMLRTLATPRGLFGYLVVFLILFAAAFAPLLAPYDPNHIDFLAIAKPPSESHWLGTDEAGRDILSRLIFGSRVSVIVVVVSIGSAMICGAALGLVSGYLGGIADEVIMRIVDGILSFPTLVLALLVIALIGPGLSNAIIAMAIVYTPNFARLVRSETLSVKSRDFVSAAIVSGMRTSKLLLQEVLPNIMGNILVYASLLGSTALITESALSFLGLGIQPPAPSWGYMIASGMQYWTSWWISFFPGAAIFTAVIGLNFLGDAMRDSIDPSMRH